MSDNPESPFYQASYLAQGTLLYNAEGSEVGQATVIEATGPDGDAVWGYTLYYYDEGPGKFYFMAGTGKWEGIVGEGIIDRAGPERTDGNSLFSWEIAWQIEEGLQRLSGPEVLADYPNETRGWSFHSPHYTDRVKNPGTDNYLFVQNYQEQKIIVEDPEDPFYMSAAYWQGTTITDTEGKVLMDTGIKSFHRPDGHVIWAVAIWWYEKEPCEYRIIGGTGKWKNMRGTGTSLPGTTEPREDRNFVLNWKFNWTMD